MGTGCHPPFDTYQRWITDDKLRQKGFKTETLRDHMDDIELIITMLGENRKPSENENRTDQIDSILM